jgi:hypothetical protein
LAPSRSGPRSGWSDSYPSRQSAVTVHLGAPINTTTLSHTYRTDTWETRAFFHQLRLVQAQQLRYDAIGARVPAPTRRSGLGHQQLQGAQPITLYRASRRRAFLTGDLLDRPSPTCTAWPRPSSVSALVSSASSPTTASSSTSSSPPSPRSYSTSCR